MMSEMKKIQEKLGIQLSVDVYVSLLDLAPNSKQEHRKSILDFLCLLMTRDKLSPDEKDYEDYHHYLTVTRKKSLTLADNAISYVKRFYDWLSENPNCHDVEKVKTLPKQRPRRKRSRRVSTLLSSCLYENLQLLAEHDNTDIPTILNTIVARYIAHRKGDINCEKSIQES